MSCKTKNLSDVTIEEIYRFFVHHLNTKLPAWDTVNALIISGKSSGSRIFLLREKILSNHIYQHNFTMILKKNVLLS